MERLGQGIRPGLREGSAVSQCAGVGGGVMGTGVSPVLDCHSERDLSPRNLLLGATHRSRSRLARAASLAVLLP